MRKEVARYALTPVSLLAIIILLLPLYSGTEKNADKLTGFSVSDGEPEEQVSILLASPELEKGLKISSTAADEPGALEESEENLLKNLYADFDSFQESKNKNISVIIVLKDQPFQRISEDSKTDAEIAIQGYSSEIASIDAKVVSAMSEEEILSKGLEGSASIASSILSTSDQQRRFELMASIDSAINSANIKSLDDARVEESEDKEMLIGLVEECGGTVSSNHTIINAVTAVIPESCLYELNKNGEIAAVYENKISTALLDISTPSMGGSYAHSMGYTGGVWDAAVIDTGVDGSHPNLVVDYAKTFHPPWYEQYFIGYDDNDDTTNDLQGHGTHCAGIVESNHATYKGVAYGLDKFSNGKAGWRTDGGSGSMYDGDMMDAVDWAVYTGGADVISYSFGSSHISSDDCSSCRFMDSVVDGLGVSVVVAAGNDGPGGNTVGTPAIAYNIFSVASVYDGSTTNRNNDVISSYSSRGYTSRGRIKPDIAAPGQYIYSTNNKWESESDFVSMSGTSMATPHITGAVVLAMDMMGTYSPRSVKALLLNTAQSNGTFSDKSAYGWGYVDMAHAYAHRYNVFSSYVYENGDYKLYKGHMDAGEKATMVWNRHASYNGDYPSTYYSLNDLDIYLYNQDTNGLLDYAVSSIENVEQVETAGSYETVIKVRAYTTNFYHNADYEYYSLAAEDGFTQTTKPTLSGTLLYNTTVYDSQIPFTISERISNTGGTKAHSVYGYLGIPAGLSFTSGSYSKYVSPVAGGSTGTAVWTLTTSQLGTYSGIYANFSHSSYGFSDKGSTQSVSINVVDDDTAAPALSSISYPSSIYGDQVFNISAVVQESSGVGQALLWYDFDGNGVFEGSYSMSIAGNAVSKTLLSVPKSKETQYVSFIVDLTDGDNDRSGDSLRANMTRRYIYVLDDDTTYPSFSSWSYTNSVDIAQPIAVSVRIADASSISQATLYYDYGGDGTINGTLTMTQAGDVWSTIIPASNDEQYLNKPTRFIVEALDNDNDRTGDSLKINSSWQNVSVGDDDTEAPEFISIRYTSYTRHNESNRVSANITDQSGLKYAKVYYDLGDDGSINGNSLMEFTDGLFNSTLPPAGGSYETQTVSILLEAEDNDSETETDSLKANSTEFIIDIIDDDTTKPAIGALNFTPTIYGDGSVTVATTASDDSGISYSKIYYSYSGGPQSMASMDCVSGNCEGNIPAPGKDNEESEISFFLEVSDADDERSGDSLATNSSINTVSVIDDDETPPSFAQISYQVTITGEESITVNASINDSSGINSSRIYYDYGADGSIDGTAVMSASGESWIGTIPAPGLDKENTNISFVVQADDNDRDRPEDFSSSNSSENNVSVSDDDTSAPSFNQWYFDTVNAPNSPIYVSVNITDKSELKYAKLYYDYGKDNVTDGTLMMTQAGDIWNATIPAPGMSFQNETVSMTIEAEDNDTDVLNDSIIVNSSEQYFFVTDLLPEVTINDPENDMIYTGVVPLNVSVSENVVIMNLSVDYNYTETLCTDCNNHTSSRSIPEGLHTIRVRVIDYSQKIGEASSYFTVDLSAPVIHNYNYDDNSPVRGDSVSLSVNYSENFIESVSLFFDGARSSTTECSSGSSKVCSMTKDISGYSNGSIISFYFVVNDTSGRSVNLTRPGGLPYRLVVDRDEDKDGLLDDVDNCIGGKDNITTNFGNINVTINGSSDLVAVFSGVQNVSLGDGADNFVEFEHDFSAGTLNLSSIVVKRDEVSGTGSIIITGITATNKTVYVNDSNVDVSTLCIKDAQVSSISEITSSCSGSDEYYISCPGTVGRYSCSVEGSRYKVSGLQHSAVEELYVSPSVGTGGGGGGGGAVTTRVTTIIPTADGVAFELSANVRGNLIVDGIEHYLEITSTSLLDVLFLIDEYYYSLSTLDRSKNIDVDKDGNFDITVELEKISKGTATIIFSNYQNKPSPWSLLPPAARKERREEVATETHEQQQVVPEAPEEEKPEMAPREESPSVAKVSPESSWKSLIAVFLLMIFIAVALTILLGKKPRQPSALHTLPLAPQETKKQVPVEEKKTAELQVKVQAPQTQNKFPKHSKPVSPHGKETTVHDINEEIRAIKEEMKGNRF